MGVNVIPTRVDAGELGSSREPDADVHDEPGAADPPPVRGHTRERVIDRKATDTPWQLASKLDWQKN